MSRLARLLAITTAAAAVAVTARARAQSEAEAPPPGSVTVPSGEGEVVVTPGTTTTQTHVYPYGLPAPGTDLNPGLPSSSRPTTDTSRVSDSFDLNVGTGEGANTVRGRSNATAAITRAMRVPRVHTVKRGDTLWDLCAYYYRNPWQWPQVWAYNPQIQNPHWIYPGDEIRMRTGSGRGGFGTLGGAGAGEGGEGVVPETVFLQNQGYIGDPARDVWGKLVGAKEDQMLLSEENNVYLLMRPGANLKVGQQLTLFRPVRLPRGVKGARQPPGKIVRIQGTVRVDQWNPKKRVARARIVESLDVIERGALVGPVRRRFDVVPPRPNQKDVQARVLTSIYPHVYLGQHQLAFLDRGSEDGLVPGNRLFVVRRGDTWRRSLKTTTRMAQYRLRLDVHERVAYESTPLEGNEQDFPEEIVAELRVLRTEKYSCLALVTAAEREVVSGDRAIARAGY
jgi:hypothetical protein